MDLPADLAELRLDERVDVLGGGIHRVEAAEHLAHLRELGVVEESRGVQALRVLKRSLDVVGQELRVVGLHELPHGRRELTADTTGPERHSPPSSASGVCRCSSSIRRESSMSFTCTASWPIRSAAVNAVALRSILRRSGS